MSRAALVVALLLATGCSGTTPQARQEGDPPGDLDTGAICPGAHQVYDALVASNPQSQVAFRDQLRALRTAADAQARDALDPVVTAADALVAAGRGPDFGAAQDGVYESIVQLDEDCRAAGAFILH